MCRIYTNTSDESLPNTYVRLCGRTRLRGKRIALQPKRVVNEFGREEDGPDPQITNRISAGCCERSRDHVLEQYRAMVWW